MATEEDVYKRAYWREKNAKLQTEQILEDKTRELYLAKELLEKQFAELKKQIAETELFYSVARYSQGNFTFQETMQMYIDAVCKLCGWPVGHVLTYNDKEKLLTSMRIWHLEDDEKFLEFKTVSENMHFAIHDGLPGRVLESGQSVWVPNVLDDGNFPRAKFCMNIGVRSGFAVPIYCYDKLLAVAEFFTDTLKRKNDHLLKLIQLAAAQLKLILERRESERNSQENYAKLQQALNNLEFAAHYDTLTSLPNKILFERKLQEELSSSPGHTALLLINLDHFKSINDSLGRALGDKLLKEVAKRLQIFSEAEDFLANLNGDEFALILADTTLEVASATAHKIISTISVPFNLDTHRISVNASIGIATTCETEKKADLLFKNADLALSMAKDNGRNQYKYFKQDLFAQHLRVLSFETNLISAISNNELYLFYQPIYEMPAKKIFAFEVLMRWNHPTLGSIAPSEFIPIAEKTGLIVSIGEWMLKNACYQWMEWREKYRISFRLAINVSAKQLIYDDFVQTVVRILQETGFPPDYLELEITETATVKGLQNIENNILRLHELGIHFAIDDFGTGYSSLSRLTQLPIDTLKIDQSFVRNIHNDSNSAAIIKSTIGLGKSLGLNIIAEGIEKQEQVDFIVENGCHCLQGYLFSPPKSVEEVDNLLKERIELK